MKGLLFFLILLASGFCSCKKKVTPEPAKAAYHISGIRESSMQKIVASPAEELWMGFDITYVHGEKEILTFTLEGEASGLGHRFLKLSGTPPFSTVLVLTDSGVVAGSYQLSVVATGEKSGTKKFPFKLKVIEATDCSAEATGLNLKTLTNCTAGNPYFQDISPVAGQSGIVLFSNFDNTGAKVYGYVKCGMGVGIKEQTVNGVIYKSSHEGRFSINGSIHRLEISYTRDGNPCFSSIEYP